MTTSNIDCDFDSAADGAGGEYETFTTLSIWGDSATAANRGRAQFRHPLGVITPGADVTDVTWQTTVNQTVTTGTCVVHAYNGDGKADPDADTGTNKYSRSVGGTALLTGVTNFASAAQYDNVTLDLTATADAYVEANISSPGFFSIGLSRTTITTEANSGSIFAVEQGALLAKLIVVWTPPATTWVPRNAFARQAVQRAAVR